MKHGTADDVRGGGGSELTGPMPDGYRGRPPDGPPGHPRLFVAVPMPEAAASRVGEIIRSVRDALGPDGRPVRWVQVEGLHLTLRFLGPTAPDRVDEVAAAVSRAAQVQAAPFEIRLGGAGAFPDASRPRALWLGIRAGAENLGRLAAAVSAALNADGWNLEERPYRPHLTIARTDGVRAGATAGQLLMARAADVDLSFEAAGIVLYRSHLGHGPARYEHLSTVAFG
jgi:2'-5' RNA ligase